MRGKRAKQYRKLMHSYSLTFQFREPYQTLLDAQIIQDATRFKMDLVGGLERTLQGKVKPMITQCSMRHLYTLPTDNESLTPAAKSAMIEQAKTFERRRCNHHELPEPLSTLECLSSVVDPKSNNTNKHRYIVASQETEVRARMRGILGVPLVYINRSVMIMEPMAGKSEEVREREEKGKFRAGLSAKRGAKRKHEEEDRESDGEGTGQNFDSTRADGEREDARADASSKKKRKGPSGPNPLSIKKSKKAPIGKQGGASQKRSADEETAQAAYKSNHEDGSKKKRRKRKHGNNVSSAQEATAAGEDSDT